MVQADSLNKERIIVIGGPTCVGKSDYAVNIALKYDGEIVNADSVQLYKYLDIGSGKLTEEEMKGVPHHLMDILEPYVERYSVALYLEAAKHTITDIISRGKMPVVVGGTGFYINALLHGYNCGGAGPNYELRRRLEGLEKKFGKGYLYDMLLQLDKDTLLHPNDTVRVIRQLELYLSPQRDAEDSTTVYHDAYDAVLVVMDADRAKLDERAAKRIEGMFSAGFMKEVRGLARYFGYKCMDTVGYKEAVAGIRLGKSDDEIKADMRASYHKLIKKQQTFFKWRQWKDKVVLYDWDEREANDRIARFMKG